MTAVSTITGRMATTDEVRFTAMGSDAHVVVVDPSDAVRRDALRVAGERIEQLEARWSRFRPTSEISRLNELRGVPVVVSHDTYRLIEHAVKACDFTGGRYDPTVLDAIVALGYNRDFAEVRAAPSAIGSLGQPAPGCAGVRLDPYVRSVGLGVGVGFDPGGIGKGLAADIVVEELRACGLAGAMVNLGGDVAVDGQAPTDDGWIVGIEDPCDASRIIARVTLESGGVCTSSSVRRAWRDVNGRTLHHLVDPRDGQPLESSLRSVTIVAGAAWWAEATAKAYFVASAETQFGVQTSEMRVLLEDVHGCCVDDLDQVSTFGEVGVFDLVSDQRRESIAMVASSSR